LAEGITSESKKIKDVSKTQEIGGRLRELRIVLDKKKVRGNGAD